MRMRAAGPTTIPESGLGAFRALDCGVGAGRLGLARTQPPVASAWSAHPAHRARLIKGVTAILVCVCVLLACWLAAQCGAVRKRRCAQGGLRLQRGMGANAEHPRSATARFSSAARQNR